MNKYIIDNDEIEIEDLKNGSFKLTARLRNTSKKHSGVYKSLEKGIADCIILFAIKGLSKI